MTWAEGDPTDASALAQAGVAHADAVILGAADSRPPKEVSRAATLAGQPGLSKRHQFELTQHVVGASCRCVW